MCTRTYIHRQNLSLHAPMRTFHLIGDFCSGNCATLCVFVWVRDDGGDDSLLWFRIDSSFSRESVVGSIPLRGSSGRAGPPPPPRPVELGGLFSPPQLSLSAAAAAAAAAAMAARIHVDSPHDMRKKRAHTQSNQTCLGKYFSRDTLAS